MTLLIQDEYPEKLFREDGKRLDGRDKDDLRDIKMEVGVIKNADGSAYIEWGNNKIFASVYGPREVHPHHLAKPDKGILRVFYRMTTYSVFDRKRPAPGRREKEISMIIADCLEPVLFLELYPGTSFEIFIEVVDADFSEIESVLKEYDKNGYYVVEMKPHYVANTPTGIYVHFAKKR